MFITPNFGLKIFNFDWVMRKVKELKEHVGIACDIYEGKFKALLTVIEISQPFLAKLTI